MSALLSECLSVRLSASLITGRKGEGGEGGEDGEEEERGERAERTSGCVVNLLGPEDEVITTSC